MEIRRGWKLFEMDSKGRLFPLFIGKKEETPKNEWIMAEIIEHHPGFAHRPGWHIGTGVPSAPPPERTRSIPLCHPLLRQPYAELT